MKILVFNGSPKRDKSDMMHITREEREAEARRRFKMKQAKKKEKRRGH